MFNGDNGTRSDELLVDVGNSTAAVEQTIRSDDVTATSAAVGVPVRSWLNLLRAACYWTLFVVGVVGNLLVLTLAAWRRSQKQVS